VFNPDQVNALRLLLEQQGVVAKFEGHFCRTLHLSLPRSGGARACYARPREDVEFYKPENVFGVPHERSCLAGIGDYAIEVPAQILYEVDNARIIGNQALIDAEPCLYRPDPLVAGTSTKMAIDGESHGHGGYALHLRDNVLCATFASRAEPREFARTALFLHNLEPGNYGSFLFRLLPQMMFAAEAGISFDAYVTPDRTPWFMDALRLLGLPERPVFAVREVCGDLFRKVFFSTGFDTEGLVSGATRRGFTELARRSVASEPRIITSQKLYVSRMLSASARPWYRVLENENVLEQHAARAGYAILYPETLTFSEQIRAFGEARLIVGPSGSGMLNAVLAEDGAKVLDMESFHTTVRQHAKIYASTRKRYSFLFGQLSKDDGGHPITRPWFVPEDLFRVGIDWLAS
jgi:hypothetical protein